MARQALSLPLNASLFHPGQRVGVAVSGGADSVALLRALLDRREALGLVLAVVHVHHGIRGEEADRDQAFVKELATAHGLALHVCRVDTPARVQRLGETLEEAARYLRYGYFRELLEAGLLDAVATAHTLDDQAETVMQKLLRGAWTEGLGGISPVVVEASGTVLRPLLETTRQDVESYLNALGQVWCADSTNHDVAHTRNRIRRDLMPMLRGFNPQIAGQLSRVATIARDEEAYWQKEVARIGRGMVLPGRPVRGGGRAASTQPGEASLALELERLRGLGPAVQRRLLRWMAAQMQCMLGFEDTERLLHLCGLGGNSPNAARRLELAGGLLAQRTGRELQLSRKKAAPAGPEWEARMLPVPGTVAVPELGLIFTAISEDNAGSTYAPARIRCVQAGDRVTPRHAHGPRTTKEVLERLHLGAVERRRCPVVTWSAETWPAETGPPETGQAETGRPESGEPGQERIVWLGDGRGGSVELEPASVAGVPFRVHVEIAAAGTAVMPGIVTDTE